MERNDKNILDQIRLLGLPLSEEKKENLMTLIQIYMDVVKRCPYLAKTPQDETKELIRILKEYHII